MTALDDKALFWEHVEAFRGTLFRMLAIIVLGMMLSFFFYIPIITFLTSPLINTKTAPAATWVEERIEHVRLKNNDNKTLIYQLPNNLIDILDMSPDIEKFDHNLLHIPSNAWLIYTRTVNPAQLFMLGPLEGMSIAFKTSLWVGALATSPLWLLILFQFIDPALHGHERRLIIPFLLSSLVLMAAGGLFAFKITIPLANEYLSSFNQAIGINLWSLEHYLNYSFFLLLANSLAFECCVIGIFSVHLGIVTGEGLRSHRRVAIVLAFVMGAFLTPPDVFTQLMLAIPLIMLYEIVILYASLKKLTYNDML